MHRGGLGLFPCVWERDPARLKSSYKCVLPTWHHCIVELCHRSRRKAACSETSTAFMWVFQRVIRCNRCIGAVQSGAEYEASGAHTHTHTQGGTHRHEYARAATKSHTSSKASLSINTELFIVYLKSLMKTFSKEGQRWTKNESLAMLKKPSDVRRLHISWFSEGNRIKYRKLIQSVV